jgi:hypothetical protein
MRTKSLLTILLTVLLWLVTSNGGLAQTTERVSVDSNGTEGDGYSYCPSISSNGRYVVFGSDATNLVPGDNNGTWDVFVHDSGTSGGDGGGGGG